MRLFFSGGTKDNNHWRTPETLGFSFMLTWYQIRTGTPSDSVKKTRGDTTYRFAQQVKK